MEKLKGLLWTTVSLVGVVLLLTGFGFYYISIRSQQDGAREEIERISEEQQILSQQIVRNILLATTGTPAANGKGRAELGRLLQVFKVQHRYLAAHAADAGLGSKGETAQLSQLIRSASPAYHIISHAAAASVEGGLAPLSKDHALLERLDQSEQGFMEKMNRISAIARANQEEVDRQVYLLNVSIYATLILSLVILGLLVITPIFKKSIRDYLALASAKDQAEAAGGALAESEEKYRHLFASNPLPMWLFDPKTFRILDVNEIACTHYGYSREEFLSMSIADIRPDEQKAAFASAEHPLTLPADEYDRGTWKHRKKDGSEITVEIFAHDALFNGNSARMVVINDVTKRKAAEEKLLHNEANLRQAQQMAHFGHWELSFSTGRSIWSAEACRIYGLEETDNEHSYESWLSFIHPEDLPNVLRLTEVAQQQKGRAEFYHRIVLRDGSIRHLFSQSHFVLEGGRPIGMYGVAHDVTPQKLAEERLINANRLYSVISGINQLIVHTQNEDALLQQACHIAITLGRFDLAWVGKLDHAEHTLNLLAHSNADEKDLELISCVSYEPGGIVDTVLQSGSHYYLNDTGQAPSGSRIGAFASQGGFRSFICLPIKRSGMIYATLNLFSKNTDLFDPQEVLLLQEVASDISFSLEVFDKKAMGALAEKKLQHSALRLRQAQSIAHVGSWDLDFSDGVALWSEEHCRIYGLDPSDNLHSFESWLSFVHPEDKDYVKQAIQGDGKTFQNAPLRHRTVRPDGTIRHLNMHSQYELGSDGQPAGLYGVSHDVTESAQAEVLLIQSEANLRLIMDLLPQRIFIKDRSGRFLFVNQSFAELYGMEPKEFISASRSRELPEVEGDEGYQRDDLEVIAGGKKKIVPEEPFVGPNGEQKIFHVTKLPYFWGREKQQSVLGILNEITEQKKAEAERNEMLSDLVRRNESLEQFAYIISHNLRAPVANILALSQLLETSCEDPAAQTALVTNLSTSTQKLDGVIQDLNKILRSTHHSSGKREKVSFSYLCEESSTDLSGQLGDRQGKLVTDFSAVDEIYATKSYLYSIFYNLISNSIKYRRSAIPLQIDISSRLEGGKIQLTFADNGLGMDLDRMGDELFGLYKRFHGHVEGKGMGLYMVKRHVELLGGEISLTSTVDVGTTFTITLPAC